MLVNLKTSLQNIKGYVDALLNKSQHQVDHWFTKETHKIAITGLSRSGKSMLFTSLITTLKYRCEEHYHCLPLLKNLPSHLVDSVRIEDVQGCEPFPIHTHIQSLEHQAWPAATEQVYAFKLIVKLKQTGTIKKHLLPYSEVIFEFFDYPGEWITDLPMLNQTFSQWSDSAWAQQVAEPQRYYAQAWHEFVQNFNFEASPNPENRASLVQAYRRYLQASKLGGISLLQPGSFLISGSGFNWKTHGFTPLPTKVTSDSTNPWNQLFSEHYQHFLMQWLTPLKTATFQASDKQVILIDLFEGLNHSKQHLLQLKETLSKLSQTFVYGNANWFSKHVLRKSTIGKVAFVATKSDLIPDAQKENLLALLKDITEGARSQFSHKEIEFEHFLVSAIQATDPGTSPNSLRYTNTDNQHIEVQFETLPSSVKQMKSDENFPTLPVKVPKDYLPRILNGRGMDRLFQYLLE